MVLCIPSHAPLGAYKKIGAYLMPMSQISQGKPVFQGQRKGNTNKLQPYRQEQVRAQIQVRQILNLIQDHVLNGTEIAISRLTAGLKLIDKVLPNAIPDAIAANNQAQAIESIARTQLLAMAQEMLKQGAIDAHVIDGTAHELALTNPGDDEITTDESE